MAHTIPVKNKVVVLGLLALFHLWDALVTIYFLQRGLATELNPLMALMFFFGPHYFLISKALLVLWGSVILAIVWDSPTVRRAAYILTTLYGILSLYEAAVLYIHWNNK